VRANDVFNLVNTLHFISWRHRVQSSAPGFRNSSLFHLRKRMSTDAQRPETVGVGVRGAMGPNLS
jgi:hypothetical protein